jgi:hypothetical protein
MVISCPLFQMPVFTAGQDDLPGYAGTDRRGTKVQRLHGVV